LLNKKKFDLRMYVLVSSVKPLVAYLNVEGLARFCTEDYSAPSNSNLLNNFMHLSNYSLNKNSPSYNFVNDASTVTEINQGSKQTLASLWKMMEIAGHKQGDIMPKIEDLIVKFLTSIYPFILFNYKCVFGKKEAKCFHVIGFDVILDELLNPYLLEINANPSLSIVFDPHKNDIKEAKKEQEISFVDLFVKEKVVEDCLKIVTMPLEEQLSIGRGNFYHTYKLLIDGEIQELNEMNLFTKMLEIYGYLSGYKFNDTLNSSKFSRLGTCSYLTNHGINRPVLEILYKKLVGTSKNGMDFYAFIDAIEMISSKIDVNYKSDDKLPSVSTIVNDLFIDLNLNSDI